jgi:excisionase family DNA binding protein
MQNRSDPPATLSVQAAAKLAGIGARTLREEIKSGRVEVLRLGRRERVLRVPFERMLQIGLSCEAAPETRPV